MTRLAIAGYGAIAGVLARTQGLSIAAVLARPGREEAARAVFDAVPVVTEVAALPPVDLLVECAGHGGLRAHGPAALARGLDVLSVASGALADAAFQREIEAAAARGARLRLASGAVGALDALSAAAQGRLDRVNYTGRKPPEGWRGSPAEDALDLDALDRPAVHFEGSARDCALAYPKNANVAASVALAGLGFEATRARLIADPGASRNIHEVTAEGDFGAFSFTIEGRGLPGNPRSSALTAMSLIRAIRDRDAGLVLT